MCKGLQKLIVAILCLIISLTACGKVSDKKISEEFEFDKEGRPVRKVAPDGGKTKFKYNEQGLPIEIEYPDDHVRYGYDANGNRIWMQNRSGRTEYKYDPFDRLIEVVFKYSPEKIIRYEYDPWDRITDIKILENDRLDYQVKYEYNILGNLTSIDDGNGRIEYNYYPETGEIVRHLPNGIKTIFSYSPLGEMTSLKHLDPQNTLLAAYHYEYDHPGQVSRVIEKAPAGTKTTRYEWDSRGYLKTLHLPVPDGNTIQYSYNPMGNRVSMKDSRGFVNYNYDGFGRLIKAGGTEYEWDKNSNLISQTTETSKTRFRYDGRGLPASISTPDATIHYNWDGDGNMISSTKGKDITHYLPDLLAPQGFTLAEFDATGRIKSSYLYGDTLIGQSDINGKIKYFLEDGFNSIRYISNTNGRVIGNRLYDRVMKLIEDGQRFPIGPGFTEKELRQLEPEYYKMIDELDYAPDITDVNSLIRLMYFGTPGLIMSHWIREGAIGFGFIDRTPISPFVAAIARRGELFFSKFVMSQQGGYLIANQFAGLQKGEDEVNRIASFWRVGRGIKNAYTQSFERYNKLYLGPGTEIEKGQYTWDWLLPEWRFSGKQFLGRSVGEISRWFVRGELNRLIGGEESYISKVAKFYGTRMDRPYWRWSPMKRIPQEDDNHDEDNQVGNKPPFCPFCGPPDGGGGGGPGGPGGPFGKGGHDGGDFRDPFKSIEAKLGGVNLDLEPMPTQDLKIGKLKAVVYDPKGDRLVLVGDEEVDVPSMRVSDLAEALALVYNPRFFGPQFSLDPADPSNIRGEELRAVYIPEIMQGTETGRIMFETDWLLKQYSFGVVVDSNGMLREKHSRVEDYKSEIDIAFFSDSTRGEKDKWLRKLRQKCPEIEIVLKKVSYNTEEEWARLWIEIKDKKIDFYIRGTSAYIGEPVMLIKAKRQEPDPNPNSRTGLRDVESENPSAKAFADEFQCLYDEFIPESPAYGRLKEIAKALAVAKWLKSQGFDYDNEWIKENLYEDTRYVTKAPAISWGKKRTTEYSVPGGVKSETRTIQLFGGVDAAVEPHYVDDRSKISVIDQVVRNEIKNGVSGRFAFTAGEEKFTGLVVPLHAQKKIRKPKIIEVNRTKYEIGENGKIVKSTILDGTVAEYSYDAMGKLTGTKIQISNGWKLAGEKQIDETLWIVNSPNGNKLHYLYDKSGFLKEVSMNGEKLASFSYRPERNEISIDYQNYVETISLNNNGTINEYRVYSRLQRSDEKINYGYDRFNRITEVSGMDAGQVSITYYGDSFNPLTIKTPRGKINYTYDSNHQIKDIQFLEGRSVHYSFEGQNIEKLSLKKGDKHSEFLFSDGNIVRVKDFMEGITEYEYNQAGLLTSIIDPQGYKAEYRYDEENRLSRINLPDGRWIEYRQVERPTKKQESSSPIQTLKVLTHASSSPISERERRSKQPEKVKEVPKVLTDRLEDIKEAGKNLKNGLIVDIFVEEKDTVHTNIADREGTIHEVNTEAAKELRKLLNITSKTHGKLGGSLLTRWQRFYDANLSHLSKLEPWTSDRKVKIKPILIIKSNEVNYKYSNLEKVPVLADNFIIFIASKTTDANNESETSAKDLVAKINSIPKLTKDNVAFIIRLPDMREVEQEEWSKEINNLQELIGRHNILVDPTKEELEAMLKNRGKDIIAIELTHTDKGILLKNGERYTSDNIKQGGDLSHIKYLISGIGTCNLPQLEEGKLAAALREKGVGIINGSYREVSSKVALEKLRGLISILRDIKEYDLYPYYLIDIINQRLGITGEGTTNLGKREESKDYLFG